MRSNQRTAGNRSRLPSWLRCCAALLALAVFLSACHRPQHVRLTVSVAASLREAVVGVEAAYEQSHADVDFSNNFASSGTLAEQIEQGAPVDVFLSAGSKQMAALEARNLIVADTRRDLLRNSLVLIAPLDSKLESFQGLTSKSVRVIALGDPISVPAGQYAHQTLISMHLLDKIEGKVVFGKDVRQVLTYVETGNADAGLVYATDAMISGKVRVVATAPASTHSPIVYPVAVVKGSRSEAAAQSFVAFLRSPAAEAIFVRHGFTMAKP